MTFQFQFKYLPILMLSVSLIACGSDNSSSTTTTAPAQITVTSDNVQNLALATAKTSTFTIEPTRKGEVPDPIKTVSDILAGIDFNNNFDGLKCPNTSGNYSVTGNETTPTIDIDNLCFMLANTDRAFINGSLHISNTNAFGDFDITLDNVSILAEGHGATLVYNCTLRSTAAGVVSGNCSSPYVSSVNTYVTGDPILMLLDQINLTGDSEIGYLITGSLHSPDGYVQIDTQTASPLYFNCTNNAPSAGMISIIGSNGASATADFSDLDVNCFTYELCLYEQDVLVSCGSVQLPGAPQ